MRRRYADPRPTHSPPPEPRVGVSATRCCHRRAGRASCSRRMSAWAGVDGMAVRWWCSRLGGDACLAGGRVVCRLGQDRRRFLSTTSGANAISAAAQGSTLQSTAERTMPLSNQANSPMPSSTVGGIDSPIRRSDWWPSAFGVGRCRTWRSNLTRRKVVGSGGPPSMERFGPGYALARLIATPLYRLLWRVRVEGGERLPRRGPAILAANHVSFSIPSC